MVNKKLPYERDPIPEDNKPLKFEPETLASRITFGISVCLGIFFLSLVAIGIWQSFNQFLDYLGTLF
ncbi:MAG: hypothetical protein F3743_02245 [Nitrospinae bacterium]|nr:hypothetical protein [Nitrospinota bacterium]MZH14201.1 hypothetical protein [Nitrospinota bacterium]